MKELQEELIALLKKADNFKGMHAQIEEEGIFSGEYLRLIKNGQKDIKDKPKNRNKVWQLINLYEAALHAKKKELCL